MAPHVSYGGPAGIPALANPANYIQLHPQADTHAFQSTENWFGAYHVGVYDLSGHL